MILMTMADMHTVFAQLTAFLVQEGVLSQRVRARSANVGSSPRGYVARCPVHVPFVGAVLPYSSEPI